jgi:cell wall-associated NlpC family hydrolase
VQPRHAAPTLRARISRQLRANRRRVLAGLVATLSITALLAVSPVAAGADASHDPFGFLDGAGGGPGGSLAIQGWAADPDALTTPLTVVFTIDGGRAQELVESVPRPDVMAAAHTGLVVGYATTLISTPGPHTVCALGRNIGAGSSATIGCTTSTVPAPSATALAHYPTGKVESATVKGNTVTVSGWAVDPDQPTVPLRIGATSDGRIGGVTGLVPVARPDVATAQHAGPNQGFRFTLTLANGAHNVCVNAANLGLGAPNNLGCKAVQVGPVALTAAQIAAHSPVGQLEAANPAGPNAIAVRGWASDPDNKNYPLVVLAYTDGTAHTPVRATLARTDLASNPAAGSHSGFAYNVSVSTASHIVCLWAVNIGVGANTALGCLPVSTAGASMATGPRPAPSATGVKVVAAAKKFLGGKYVWGAENPKVGFDCSGLVQYTYASVNIPTPRVAQDQFSAAHMITAGRAVPGDLVFYHDNQGNVYHVGIYVSPGLTYAAVDEAEGIKVQPIWDNSATYGSFTHS